MEIIIRCYGCVDYNKHKQDEGSFDQRTTDFTSFTDAHTHQHEHPDHQMELMIRPEDED